MVIKKFFLPGRFIGENIRLLHDIMFELEKQNLAGMLLPLDFEKAFDSVSWKFINKVFDVFNFGDSIKKWVQLFQFDSESCIIQNGYFSRFFKLERGCRQGDPISPYIFILCAEILGIAIRNNKGIKGIKIWNTVFKVSQYADDTSLLLDGSEQSLKESLNTFTWYYKISGLKINVEKTKVTWLGSMRESDRRFCRENDLEWTSSFKALGVDFNTSNIHSITESNINPKIQQMKNLLNLWSNRNLTPFGKITVIKSLILPQITHLLISLPNPDDKTIKNLDQLLSAFIWNKKPPKISKKQFAKTYEEGGLNMININNYIDSLKLTWIRRFFSKQSQWNIFPHKYGLIETVTVGPNGHTFMPKLNNPFWMDVFSSWVGFSKKFCQKYEPNSCNDILNQPIWGNPMVKLDFIKPWYTKGIHFVRDLIGPDGSLKSMADLSYEYCIKITFLDYHRLTRAIPSTWLNVIANKSDTYFPCIPPQLLSILSVKRGCRAYSSVLSYNAEDDTVPTSQTKWNRDLALENDITNLSFWKKVYKLPFIITLDTNLRYFQHKILKRILPTNKLLTLIKIKDNDVCTFCESHVETLLHLFVNCDCITQLWEELRQWLVSCGYLHIQILERQDIVLGNPKEDIIFNFTLLITKLVIYRSKLSGRRPTLAAVKAYLKYIMEIEKYIAMTNNAMDKFYGKWASVIHKL
jgi:hypothetical protein